WISLVMALAVAGAVTLIFGPDPFALLWLGLFALQNFQRARAAVAYEPAAVRLESGGGPFRQAAALRLRAGIELARGDNESAAMLAGQSFSIWQSADAAVVAA